MKTALYYIVEKQMKKQYRLQPFSSTQYLRKQKEANKISDSEKSKAYNAV